jgi:hypothetical protein
MDDPDDGVVVGLAGLTMLLQMFVGFILDGLPARSHGWRCPVDRKGRTAASAIIR